MESVPNNWFPPGESSDWWLKRHHGLSHNDNPNILFLGDSITDHFRDVGQAVWNKHFASMKAANFGISSDRIQHLMWRIQNSQIYDPRYIVLLIGTNNTGVERDTLLPRNTNQQIIEGLQELINYLLNRSRSAQILFYLIWPRTDKTKEQLDQIQEINREITKFKHSRVTIVDMTPKINQELLLDGLHPNEKGYEVWAESIVKNLTSLNK